MEVDSTNLSAVSSRQFLPDHPKNNPLFLKVAIVAGVIFSLISAGVAIAFGPITGAIVLAVTMSALIIMGIAGSILPSKKKVASETKSNISLPEVQKIPLKEEKEAYIVKHVTDAYVPLKEEEKLQLRVENPVVNKNSFSIFFGETSKTELRIQINNMLEGSCTEVVVNAANTHLRITGNTGVNDQIITQGGEAYQKEHLGLSDFFKTTFQEGQAAIVTSGNLIKVGIQKVIVVAAPCIKKK